MVKANMKELKLLCEELQFAILDFFPISRIYLLVTFNRRFMEHYGPILGIPGFEDCYSAVNYCKIDLFDLGRSIAGKSNILKVYEIGGKSSNNYSYGAEHDFMMIALLKKHRHCIVEIICEYRGLYYQNVLRDLNFPNLKKLIIVTNRGLLKRNICLPNNFYIGSVVMETLSKINNHEVLEMVPKLLCQHEQSSVVVIYPHPDHIDVKEYDGSESLIMRGKSWHSLTDEEKNKNHRFVRVIKNNYKHISEENAEMQLAMNHIHEHWDHSNAIKVDNETLDIIIQKILAQKFSVLLFEDLDIITRANKTLCKKDVALISKMKRIELLWRGNNF